MRPFVAAVAAPGQAGGAASQGGAPSPGSAPSQGGAPDGSGRPGQAGGWGEGRDAGQVSILLVGLVAICLTIVMGVVGVTAVQLSRIHVLDAADAAALDASDALALERAYAEGVGSGLPLTDATVVEAATAHLAQRERPARLSSWEVAPGTGSPDGRTAVVVVRGTARVPVVSSVLAPFGGGVTITMTSSARSDLAP